MLKNLFFVFCGKRLRSDGRDFSKQQQVDIFIKYCFKIMYIPALCIVIFYDKD